MPSDLPNAPIAITGMHRTGTSMITRALHDSGLRLVGTGADDLIEAADDNPEGFWENKAIVDCNNDLLEATGGSWDNPPDLPPLAVDDPRVTHITDAATAAIAALGEHEHWGFKDPRLCLTAAYWLDLVPDLRFIICVRHPLEVALSLKKRNQNSFSLGLALWERYYTSVLEQLPADRWIATHYDSFFVDPDAELARLCAFSGLTPVPPRVLPDLRHHTINVSLEEAGVSPGLQALYADLCRLAGVPVLQEPPADDGRVRRLILDGVLAQREAERLQKREDELLARTDDLRERNRELEKEHNLERSANNAEHRDRIREIEAKHSARVRELQVEHRTRVREIETERRNRINELGAEHRARVRSLEAAVLAARTDAAGRIEMLRGQNETLRGLTESVARIDARTRKTASRVEVAINEAKAGPLRRVARKLPAPAKQRLRRVRSVVSRSVSDPKPTAKALGRRVERRVEPAARSVAQRLPAPAQQTLKRGRNRLRRARGASSPAAKTGDQPRLAADIRRRVESISRPGEIVLIVSGGDEGVVNIPSRRCWAFPEGRNGSWAGYDPVDAAAAVNHLEAQRGRGARYFVLPAAASGWRDRYPEFVTHLDLAYEPVHTDRQMVVYDLAGRETFGSEPVADAPVRTGAPRLSVVVVSGDGDLDTTRHTIERIWAVARIPTEVVVIDNGSSSEAVLPAVVVYRDPASRGVAAWNSGIGLSSAPVVAVLANDCRVEPGWDEALCAAATDGRRVAFPYTDHCDGLGFARTDDGGTAAWCFALPKAVYAEVGRFDESLDPESYDIAEYWQRAWQLGVELSPVPAARVVHAGRPAPSDLPYCNREVIDYEGTFASPSLRSVR